MLKDLYQSFVIAKAAAAANFTIQNLNKRQSEDVGINPDTHFKELMAGIHTDCETQDAKAKSVVTSAVSLNVQTHSTPKINLVYKPKKTAQLPLSKAEHARDTA